MPAQTPKFRNRGESQHWSRIQAQVIGRFNWPAKRKVNIDFVERLTAQIADRALVSFRQRTERNGK
jgi:hypothetical protein